MKKLLNKKGFTLMEMMIVVAIIVILVAISIPTFSGSLNSAKEATDKANLRSAKAAVALAVAEGETIADKTVYDLEAGEFSTSATAADNYGSCEEHTSAYIAYDATNKVAAWFDGTNFIEECGEN